MPIHRVLSALRYAEFSSLDFCLLEQFSRLSPDQVCTVVSSLLTAHSQKCAVEHITISTSHLCSPRALELFGTLVEGASEAGTLSELSILGSGDSANCVSNRYIEILTNSLHGDLRVLRLPGLSSVSDSNIAAIVRAAGRSLAELDISMTAVTGTGLSRALVCEDTIPCGQNTADASTSMRSAAIGYSRQRPMRNVLEVLDITRNSVQLSDLHCLIGMQSLRDLRIGWTPAVGSESNMRHEGTNTDELSLGLGMIVGTASLPRLRRLDLSGAHVNLSLALQNAHGLEELVLVSGVVFQYGNSKSLLLPENVKMFTFCQSVCRGFFFTDFAASLSSCCGRALRTLHLNGATMFGRVSQNTEHPWSWNLRVKDAFDEMTSLRELDISHSHSLSLGFIVHILISKSAVKLTKLRLADFDRPALVSALRSLEPQLQFSALQQLDVSNSDFFSKRDEFVWFLNAAETGHAGLATVRVHNVRLMDDIAAGEILKRSASTLQELDISGNLVTNEFLRSHSKQLPSLRELDVDGCNRVDASELITFCTKYAPQLEAIYVSSSVAQHARGHGSRTQSQKMCLVGAGRAWHRAKLGADLVNRARNTAQSLPEWRYRASLSLGMRT